MTHIALDRGYEKQLADQRQQSFMCMPLMHSEELSDQELAVTMFSELGLPGAAEYAEKHKEIIVQFGRFPHRNTILDRKSTDAEQEFLKEPGSSF